jgi:hypothetical protein
MKKGLLAAAAIMMAGSASAALIAGDVMLISANADAPDPFAWVALVDIPANTTIYFTDNGIFSDNTLRTNEGTHSWSHTSLVMAGTVIKITDSNTSTVWSTGTGSVSPSSTSFNAAVAGDQIIIYTGILNSPTTYISGTNWANAGWTAGATDSNTSKAPSIAVHLGNQDNYQYNGTLTGTREQLIAAITNPTNWQVNDTTPFTWTAGNFTVIPEPGTLSILGLFGVAMAVRMRRRRA